MPTVKTAIEAYDNAWKGFRSLYEGDLKPAYPTNDLSKIRLMLSKGQLLEGKTEDDAEQVCNTSDVDNILLITPDSGKRQYVL